MAVISCNGLQAVSDFSLGENFNCALLPTYGQSWLPALS